MQKNKDGVVSYTLEYLDKSASKSKNHAATNNSVKPHSEQFFNIFSSELGIPQKVQEEKINKKPKSKPKLNLKVYAEEITSIFKEEAERVRLEEEKAERERLEKIARQRLEEEAARIRLQEEKILREKIEREAERVRIEEVARARLEQEAAERIRLEQEAAEKIRLEEAARTQLEEQVKKESLNEEFVDNDVQQINETQTNISYYAKKEPKTLNENPVNLQNVVNNGDFVTFKDLQKHYVDFINKIQVQLGSMGGGGEVLLKRLDDLEFDTFSNGYVIKYNQQTKKFYGAQESLSAEVLDGGEF